MNKFEIVEQETPVIDNSQGNLILAMIEKSVLADVDLTKLERLYDLHEKMLNRDSKNAYFSAMSRAQSNIGNVVKNCYNGHTKSSYANFAAVNAMITPAYSDEGLSVSSGHLECNDPNSILIFVDVQHEMGHKERFTGIFPIDGAGMKGNANKSPIQAVISSTSYAKRCMISSIFNVAQDESDGNNESIQDTIQDKKRDRENGVLEQYPESRFNSNLEAWKDLIESGKRTANDIIKMVSSSAVLTDEQINTIKGLENHET